MARSVLTLAVAARSEGAYPLGTLAVNLIGAFALGLLAGLSSDEQTLRLLATGLLGAFTTFSTWMVETRELAVEGKRGAAMVNVALSLLAGLLAAWLGTELGGGL